MHLLFAYYTHKPGGLCHRLYRLMSALCERGHKVTFCSLDAPPATLDGRVNWVRVPFPLSRRSGLLFWGLFTSWLPVWMVVTCMRLRPDRLIMFGAYYAAVAAPSRLVMARRLMLFMRSVTTRIDKITGKPEWLCRITAHVDRIGVRSSDLVVFMTNSMREEVRQLVGDRLPPSEILMNDLPAPAKRSADERDGAQSAIDLIVAGVLDRRKNVEVVLRALSEIPSNLQGRYRCTIAGTGPEQAALETLAADLRLSNVHFLGWCNDLPERLKQATALVHPSLHEGIANTILEGLAAGLPVLVSDIPEHAEIFPDPISRVAVSDVQAWRDALLALSEPQHRLRLRAASAAVAHSLSFDWDSRAVQIVTVP